MSPSAARAGGAPCPTTAGATPARMPTRATSTSRSSTCRPSKCFGLVLGVNLLCLDLEISGKTILASEIPNQSQPNPTQVTCRRKLALKMWRLYLGILSSSVASSWSSPGATTPCTWPTPTPSWTGTWWSRWASRPATPCPTAQSASTRPGQPRPPGE